MDLNRVILIGRMASDPELKYTPSGVPVSQFRLAVNRPMSAEARQSGQEKQADFFTIVAWRQQAEYAANYLGKGRLVAIEGKLQVRDWTTTDGQKRKETEIMVDSLKSLDRPKEDSGGSGNYSRGNSHGDEYHDEPVNPPSRQAPPRNDAPMRAETTAPRRPAASPAQSRPPAALPDDEYDDPFAEA